MCLLFFFLMTYLTDLEEQGYCVIPRVFSEQETKVLYERVWHEFIEKAWPKCSMTDPGNWKETFPIHNRYAIFAGPAGQIQPMWDLRQDPRIVEVFANVWNTPDLVVSMDGLSIMCPPEIRPMVIDPWPHVDQAVMRHNQTKAHSNNPPMGFISESLIKTKPYTIQGQFLFEDSDEEDGGFYCFPRSHLRFEEFAPFLNSLTSPERKAFLLQFFHDSTPKHVTAPKGSLILWDSRTVHWNQHPSPNRNNPKVRMSGFLCYVPKSRLTEEARFMRKEAFERGIATGHNAGYPEVKASNLVEEFERFREDPGYVQPTINLTPLGHSVLGIEGDNL